MSDVLEKLAAKLGRPLTAAERLTVLAQLPTRKGAKVGVPEMRSHVEELCRSIWKFKSAPARAKRSP